MIPDAFVEEPMSVVFVNEQDGEVTEDLTIAHLLQAAADYMREHENNPQWQLVDVTFWHDGLDIADRGKMALTLYFEEH